MRGYNKTWQGITSRLLVAFAAKYKTEEIKRKKWLMITSTTLRTWQIIFPPNKIWKQDKREEIEGMGDRRERWGREWIEGWGTGSSVRVQDLPHKMHFPPFVLLTCRSSWGEGYCATMAEAISGLTFRNCCSCCPHTLSSPLPSFPTLTPPAQSTWTWNENLASSLFLLQYRKKKKKKCLNFSVLVKGKTELGCKTVSKKVHFVVIAVYVVWSKTIWGP